MAIYKKIIKTFPAQALRLLQAATKSLLPRQSVEYPEITWSTIEGGLTGEVIPNRHERFKITQEFCKNSDGATILTGWCIDGIRRRGFDKMVVTLDRHAIIRMADGRLACPTTPIGQHIWFIEDIEHTADDVEYPAWNMAVYSNVQIKGTLGHLEPYCLGWSTNFAGDQAFSHNPKHAKWMAWGVGDPISFIAQQGLDESSLQDIAMCSDIEELITAMEVKPHPLNMSTLGFKFFMQELKKFHSKEFFKIKCNQG